jgi:hypothetical protein
MYNILRKLEKQSNISILVFYSHVIDNRKVIIFKFLGKNYWHNSVQIHNYQVILCSLV